MRAALPFSILGLIPLAHQFEFLGEQLALYFGQSVGDLIVITFSNAIEATLAIMLLINCELRLAQATIAGVVLLHLLLVPGFAFLTGGAKIWYQKLAEHNAQLNQSLLGAGFVFMLIPTIFFTALDRTAVAHAPPNGTPAAESPAAAAGEASATTTAAHAAATAAGHVRRVLGTPDLSHSDAVSDQTRDVLLQISRGLAIMMLIIYIASRLYLHNPPGDREARKEALASVSREEREELLKESKPLVNPWVCIGALLVGTAIMAVTAEWLVDSLPHFFEMGYITEEWLGLILLPITSFAADGLIATVYFIRTIFRTNPPVPAEIAHGRSIDVSIQFLLFWTPVLILVAWFIGKPLTLFF
ncbi:hypothetical protein FRB99_004511, partial [Tulasnella sp. 403]